MTKLTTLTFAAFMASGALGLSATGASAHHYGHKPCCGPLRPTIHVHTIYKHKTETHIYNKNVKVYVPRYHRIIDITRVQPIIDVHKVIVTHHHTVCVTKNLYSSKVEHLRPIYNVSISTRSTSDCHCGHHY